MRKDGTLTAGLSQARRFAYTSLSCVSWGKGRERARNPYFFVKMPQTSRGGRLRGNKGKRQDPVMAS